MKKPSIRATALASLMMNGLFGLYHAALGMWGGSWWYLTMAAYYLVLGVMRFAVLLVSRSAEVTPAFVRRFTGTAVYLLVALLGLYLIQERKNTMAKSKLVKTNEKIAEAVTDGYKKIEDGVVKGYTKIEDKFVEQFLTREGETVEQAKKRLKGE